MDVTDLRVALFTGNYNYVRDGANQALNRLVGHLLSRGAAARVYSPTAPRPALPPTPALLGHVRPRGAAVRVSSPPVPRPAFSPTGDLVSVPSVALPGRAEYRAPV